MCVCRVPAIALQVYLIWYGDWSANTATSIVTDFVKHVGGSPWCVLSPSSTCAHVFLVPHTQRSRGGGHAVGFLRPCLLFGAINARDTADECSVTRHFAT